MPPSLPHFSSHFPPALGLSEGHLPFQMRLWGIMEGEVESAETGRNGLQQRWEIWWLVDTAVRLTERAWEEKQLKEGRHMGGRGINRDCASHPGDVSKTFIKFVRTPFSLHRNQLASHIFFLMASYANSWMSFISLWYVTSVYWSYLIVYLTLTLIVAFAQAP